MSKGFQINWLILIIHFLLYWGCQSQTQALVNPALPEDYLKEEGIFLMRANACHCLDDEVHGKSLEYEILLVEEGDIPPVDLQKTNEFIEKKERLLKKKWNEWGNWQRVYLGEQLDKNIINELQYQLQSKGIILAFGKVHQNIKVAQHTFSILYELSIIN
jgi:hypothetical protein